MFKKYMKDYYLLKIGLTEICEKEDVVPSTFYRYLESNELLPRRAYYGKIDLGDKELSTKIKDKYTGIVKRCTGKPSYKNKKTYNNMEYMPVYEWVDFVNENKMLLISMWNEFNLKDRDRRYSISIDRIDEGKGYIKSNIQFVTHGFNAWKRNIKPIEVVAKGEKRYFFSSEEASRFYEIRRQYIGELLNDKKKSDIYEVRRSSIEKVLKENEFESIENYYTNKFLEI